MTTNDVEFLKLIVSAVQAIFTIALTAAGLFLVHDFRRQVAQRVSDKRLEAYSALWDKMKGASPVRTVEWNGPHGRPLSTGEREQLFEDFTSWYYENGHGLFLNDKTRSLYLTVKDNLVCHVDCFEPEITRQKLCDTNMSPEAQERARGFLSIRQLSLLRTRMKADLAVYGATYHTNLDEDDKALLKLCGENLLLKPWNQLPWKQWKLLNRPKKEKAAICKNAQTFS